MGKIVITGSTRGIGRALAERFIESGWTVIINGRSNDTVATAVSELTAGTTVSGAPGSGGKCTGLAGSASSETDMQSLWDMAAADGPVDVWINNAGVDQSRHMAWELEPGELRTLIDTNLVGSFTGTGIAARGMMSQGHGIIYQMEGFGSDGMVQPGLAAYGASKAAVRYLASALSRELKSAGSRVRSGTISPGMVMTDLLKSGLPEEPAARKQVLKIYDILADSPETVSAFIAGKIIGTGGSSYPTKIRWLTGGKAGWRFATAFARKGRFSAGFEA